MPFREVLAIDERRLLAVRVLEEGWSLSAACRASGVSRPTGRKWVKRARKEGIAALAERSRRPLSSPSRTSQELREELFALKERYPGFGAKKLAALLEGRLSVRTIGRLLAEKGLPCRQETCDQAPQRFERETPNELWQADLKGLPRRCPFEALSVLDDSSRFLLTLSALPDQTLASIWSALWEAFGEYGLPQCLMTDNGPAFRNNGTWRPSAFDARLMLLGVRPSHIRAYHPQTQGKVERFHGTLQRDLGPKLARASLEEASGMLASYRDFYNWERPHEALGQRKPGSAYAASTRKRPERLPGHEIPSGAHARKVDAQGFFSFEGTLYKAGKGMAGQHVAILSRDEDGERIVSFAGFTLGTLPDYAP